MKIYINSTLGSDALTTQSTTAHAFVSKFKLERNFYFIRNKRKCRKWATKRLKRERDEKVFTVCNLLLKGYLSLSTICCDGMVWYGMVWYGMVWYGMVWYGMVRYGMVWYGMV